MANARILAVDDSPTILEMIKAILVSGGYEVITAADGAEALETARAEIPDLILLDRRGCDGHRYSDRRQPVPHEADRAREAAIGGCRGALEGSELGRRECQTPQQSLGESSRRS